MNLDLSLILNPSELAAFQTRCEAELVAITQEEDAAHLRIAEEFAARRGQVHRCALLSLLSKSPGVMDAPTKAPKPVERVKPTTDLAGLTRKQLAELLGCDDTSIGNYEKRGFVSRIEGSGTGVGNPCLYRDSDIPALKAAIAELKAGKGAKIREVLGASREKAAQSPSPEPEIEAPEPRESPLLSEAVKHDYHWRNALPVLEAAIERAEDEGQVALEIGYQSTPGKYEERGAFIAHPFGELGRGIKPFVRATQENGKWSVTIPIRVESWLRPMAEGLKNYWQGATRSHETRAEAVASELRQTIPSALPMPLAGASEIRLSSASPTRSLPA